MGRGEGALPGAWGQGQLLRGPAPTCPLCVGVHLPSQGPGLARPCLHHPCSPLCICDRAGPGPPARFPSWGLPHPGVSPGGGRPATQAVQACRAARLTAFPWRLPRLVCLTCCTPGTLQPLGNGGRGAVRPIDCPWEPSGRWPWTLALAACQPHPTSWRRCSVHPPHSLIPGGNGQQAGQEAQGLAKHGLWTEAVWEGSGRGHGQLEPSQVWAHRYSSRCTRLPQILGPGG